MPALEKLFFKLVPGALRRWLRTAAIALVRRLLIPPLLRAKIDAEPGPAGVSVHLLVSASTWEMGMLAARSFRHFTGRQWEFFIHDDGSVPPEQLAGTHAILPGARVIPRAEADAAMESELAPFPHCRENRRKHNWFLKVFDLHHFAPGPRYIILDSDLLFFSRPEAIVRWAESGDNACWFNRDGKESYALPREEMEPEWPHPIWERVNSGLCLLQKQTVSLPRCEEFLAKFASRARHYMFLEQTLLAISASAGGAGGLLPPQYEISWENFRRRDGVCRHYVGPFKDDVFFLEGVVTLWWRMLVSGRRE